jgi:hypothetical protein
MDAKANLKSKLPSRRVTEGPEGERHPSYYSTLDLTAEQVHQPFVGVAKPKKPESGNLCKYTQQLGPALIGAVTHPGATETSTYADI